MKVWFGVIGFLIGTGVGVAAGFALEGPADHQAQPSDSAAPVPTSCLSAISAARDRLLLNPDTAATLRDYRKLGAAIADDVSGLRLPDLRRTLGEFNELNERSSELLDRSVNSRFSEAANDCEEAAGKAAP